jgi:hypothetical protein
LKTNKLYDDTYKSILVIPQKKVVPKKSVVNYKEELQDIKMFQALIEETKINDNNSK